MKTEQQELHPIFIISLLYIPLVSHLLTNFMFFCCFLLLLFGVTGNVDKLSNITGFLWPEQISEAEPVLLTWFVSQHEDGWNAYVVYYMRGEDYLLQRFFSCVIEAMAPFKSLINSARDLSSFEWATLNDLRNYAKLNQPLTRAAQDLYWESELAGVLPPLVADGTQYFCEFNAYLFIWLFDVLKLLLIAADCLFVGVHVPGACLHVGLRFISAKCYIYFFIFFPRRCQRVTCNLFAGVYLSHLAEGHRIRWQLAGSHSRVCVQSRQTCTHLPI